MKKYIIILLLLVFSGIVSANDLNVSLVVMENNTAPGVPTVGNVPSSVDVSQNINFTVIGYDGDTENLTSYCILYNNSVSYGNVIVQNITRNISYIACSVDSSLTSVDEYWYADIWVSDGQFNSSVVTTSYSLVGAWLSNLSVSNYVNLTATIEFETIIPVNYTIVYSLDENQSNLNNTHIEQAYNTTHISVIDVDANETIYYSINTYSQESGSQEIYGTYNFTFVCTESWVCGSWSYCDNSVSYRVCYDSNSCGTNMSEPETEQSCSSGGGVIDTSYVPSLTVPSEQTSQIESLLEPETCGNGKIDDGETLYNCNKDIEPNVVDYVQCLNAGDSGCAYYDLYTKLAVAIAATTTTGAAAAFALSGGLSGGSSGSFSSFVSRKKRIPRRVKYLWK